MIKFGDILFINDPTSNWNNRKVCALEDGNRTKETIKVFEPIDGRIIYLRKELLADTPQPGTDNFTQKLLSAKRHSTIMVANCSMEPIGFFCINDFNKQENYMLVEGFDFKIPIFTKNRNNIYVAPYAIGDKVNIYGKSEQREVIGFSCGNLEKNIFFVDTLRHGEVKRYRVGDCWV
jgi:hypothetical protein